MWTLSMMLNTSATVAGRSPSGLLFGLVTLHVDHTRRLARLTNELMASWNGEGSSGEASCVRYAEAGVEVFLEVQPVEHHLRAATCRTDRVCVSALRSSRQ